MIFVDCTEYCEHTGRSLREVLKAGWDVGVGWQDGRRFGASCHIRMNLAVPFSRIQDACERLEKYVFLL
jgi:cystathionine beta-lyase